MQKTQKTQKRHMTAALLALALALLLGSASPALAASAFSDVPDTHWAGSYIQTAYEKGWINGIGGGRYAPSDTLTRAQFLKMITGTFFPLDMSEAAAPEGSPWYAEAWIVAQLYDLQSGTSMSKLSDLTAKISRYDMAQIIMNTLPGSADSAGGADYSSTIQDWSSIPQKYQEAVSFAYAAGILNGKNGKFAGQDTMTRAEAAAVLCRMDEAFYNGGVVPGTQTPSAQAPTIQTPAAQTPAAQTPEEFAAEVIRLVNEERAKVGASALGTYDSLTKAAQIRAPELITKFEHTRPDGSSCFTALDETGAKTGAYTYGENIAAGQSTPAAVVESWMNSPGHKANILNKDFTHIGVGYVKGGSYGHYWVQMFTGVKGTPGGTTTTTQTPATQTPTTQTPATQTPTTQTPTTQTPATQTPTTQPPTTQTPTTQTPTTQTPAQTPEELAAEVVRLVNEERAKVGAAPLGTYDSLTKAAQIRAPELVTLFSHTRPDGTTCFTALEETGAKTGAYTWGENIAAGNATAAATVEQWMNSPGHKANMLNKDYTHIGVAYVKGGAYGHCWVQMFIGTKNVPGGSTTTTTQTPTTQTPTTQTPTTQTPSTQIPGTQTTGQTSSNGLLFTTPIITVSPGQTCLLSVVDNDYRSVNGATFTNESPELLRLNSDNTVRPTGQTGTAYVTAEKDGQKARVTIRIIASEDRISLSTAFQNMRTGGYGTAEVYVFSTSKFYGQDYTASWSVDNPGLLTLTEQTGSQGGPAVRYASTGAAGDARITCRVTMADGSTAEDYCFVHIS